MAILSRPVVGWKRCLSMGRPRLALPLAPSPYSRPAEVDITTYEYPGSPNYPGVGPRPIPDQAGDKVVHYVIPKTFVDWLEPALGKTGIYTLLGAGAFACLSKEWIVWHAETRIALQFFFTWGIVNMFAGKTLDSYFRGAYTEKYDKLYAVKEHDIEAYNEIVEQYKQAQYQSQGQALFNEQKLTNLALMLETEYLNRQNSLVSAVSQKLNYQVALQQALKDQESQHMISWIEDRVMSEINALDQAEQIEVCVAQLKAAAASN